MGICGGRILFARRRRLSWKIRLKDLEQQTGDGSGDDAIQQGVRHTYDISEALKVV